MVWIIKLIFVISLIFSSNTFSNNLNKEEVVIFNFIDLNNDNHISKLEFDQSIEIIFQLIDLNQDELISKTEIDELKNVIESLK